MKITKITQNNYLFYKDGSDYILNLGKITKGENTQTELLFEDLKDSSKLQINKTCGCTIVEKTIIDEKTASAKLSYTQCDSSFSKIINCYNDKEHFKIKLRGTCQQ